MQAIRVAAVKILTLFAIVLVAGPAQSMSLDWRPVYFRQGHPLVGENLEQSTDNTGGLQLENLQMNVSIMKEYPNVAYDLMGRANATECSPASCMMLSARRAELVYDYLLEQGIPACQIKTIVAAGTSSPIALPQDDAPPDRSVHLLVTLGTTC
ncbi:hypothetical protein FHR56_003723 [Xanthomonas sacchari]|uniref:OmpA family protein n=1 Tax=Xanthomonas sp. F10 TaxID=3035309 RepID=UPI00160B507F|nr:hypothetical protein [Xanthomonas sp. F10]MBB6368544.1 hypothetical protein [Xanthomonas sp. F10]